MKLNKKIATIFGTAVIALGVFTVGASANENLFPRFSTSVWAPLQSISVFTYDAYVPTTDAQVAIATNQFSINELRVSQSRLSQVVKELQARSNAHTARQGLEATAFNAILDAE